MELAQDCVQWQSSVLAMLRVLFLLPESYFLVALCLKFLSQLSKMLFSSTEETHLFTLRHPRSYGPRDDQGHRPRHGKYLIT
jgi:hypothetical protein